MQKHQLSTCLKKNHILAQDVYTDISNCASKLPKGNLEGGVIIIDDLTNLLCVRCTQTEVAHLVRYLSDFSNNLNVV